MNLEVDYGQPFNLGNVEDLGNIKVSPGIVKERCLPSDMNTSTTTGNVHTIGLKLHKTHNE